MNNLPMNGLTKNQLTLSLASYFNWIQPLTHTAEPVPRLYSHEYKQTQESLFFYVLRIYGGSNGVVDASSATKHRPLVFLTFGINHKRPLSFIVCDP